MTGPEPPPGRFITFEGGEGAGKSTQVRRLLSRFQASQRPAVATREPGGTVLGERIRELLVTGSPDSMDARTELLLITAARVEHVRRVIRPALERGEWVLCDRFLDSTLAYQGHGRGLEMSDLTRLNRWGAMDLKPDLTLLLDLEPATGLARRRAAVSGVTGPMAAGFRFEKEALPFHHRVRNGFLELAAREPHRFRRVDASRSEDLVAGAIWEHLLDAFSELRP